jgi:hypothetical protein
MFIPSCVLYCLIAKGQDDVDGAFLSKMDLYFVICCCEVVLFGSHIVMHIYGLSI